MFFSNMSERAAKIMREDMETMGPVRLRDVEQAQMAMVKLAKDLAAKGEIMLAERQGRRAGVLRRAAARSEPDELWAPRRSRFGTRDRHGTSSGSSWPARAADAAGEIAAEARWSPPRLAFSEDEVARLCAAAAARPMPPRQTGRAREARERQAAESASPPRYSCPRGRDPFPPHGAGGHRRRRRRCPGPLARLGGRSSRTRPPSPRACSAQLLPELRDEAEVVVAGRSVRAPRRCARGLAALAAEAGFPGLVEVRPSATLRPGEVRVAWRDGWAERLLAEAEARAAAALAALTGGGIPETVEITGADT